MHPPPCDGFRWLSWGCAVLQGHERTRLGWVWVPSDPYGVQRPSGTQRARRPSAEASGGPSWTSAPLQSSITGTPRRPAACAASQTTLPLLDFFDPTTQSQAGGSVCRRRIPPPPRVTCGVWLPPSRRTPPALPARQARWSVHGLLPSRVSPRHDRCPSRSPCLLGVTPPQPRLPGGQRRAMRPTSRPSSRDESVLTPEPQVIPAVDPFLGFAPPERAPARPGARFDHGASPLVQRRLYV